ncbi:LysR family transcriptional regulator [Palleronia caenipelagi]|uniref:LysR family transcriptional regulator n=1 Tax=Palleronia caenipelagi TaxID=2489174 RepID=A0A547PN84_9RHOB|nr:LysR family transcriptional regulator [Palleronia caenipelagi]TRD15607.1 LysR family transcriptional regulator [Palleronia caenipelagi]
MRNLDIATLRSLQGVAEYGAVTRAAEALNMTQSALSMQIKRLEEVFERPLLEKQGRGVVLTDFAQLLLTESRKLVAQNDAIIARFTGIRPDCCLRVGLTTDWPTKHLTLAVRNFREANPTVEIVLTDGNSANLIRQFGQGELDVILTTEADCREPAINLMQLPLYWVGAEGGSAWQQRPLVLTNALSCAFLDIAVVALNGVEIDWQHAPGIGSCERNLMLTAADQGVNVLLGGSIRPGLERIDHAGGLPRLPKAFLNMYMTKEKVADMAAEFGSYLRRAVEEEARELAA